MVDFGISFAYLVATIGGLAAAYMMNKASPEMNPFVKFFVLPILVIYIVLKILQLIFPSINQFGASSMKYLHNKTLGEINGMGYIQIFPMFFAVLIVFIILLYSGSF